MYKLVAIDLDGTLLNDNKEIPNETKKYLKKINQEGINIVISTGRALYKTEDYINELNLNKENEYTVLLNGAIVIENNTKKIVLSESLNSDDISSIINFANDNNVTISLYTTSYVITNKFIDRGSKKNIKVVETIDSKEFENENIFKVVLVADKEKITKTKANLTTDMFEKFEVTSSIPEYIEFTKKGIKKETALKYICDKNNINKFEVIAIGDSNNDLGMIECFGLGIAMENAEEEVKSKADYITKNNNDEGVRIALEKWLK